MLHTSTVFSINAVSYKSVSYTSSQTAISVPLYTTMILCSCVVLMADVTTSLSAYLFTWLMASCLSCSTCASVSFDLAYLSSTM